MVRCEVRWVLLLLAAFSVFGSGQSRHLITGRILSAEGARPVGRAKIQSVAVRGGRRIIIAKGMSHPDGVFGIASSPVSEPLELWISADGHAPKQLLIRSTPDGQGQHVGRLLLEKGWPLSVQLGPTGGSALPKEVSIVPADNVNTLVSLHGPRLLRVAVVNGTATFPHVGPGEHWIVIHDNFDSFRPQVIPWRMGPAARLVPHVQLSPGLASRVIVRETGEALPRAICEVGLGVWHEGTGEEMRIRWNPKVTESGDNRGIVSLTNLPHSLLELRVRSQEKWGRTELVTGASERSLTMQPGVIVHGQVRVDGSGRPVDGGWVRIGDELIRCSLDGHYRTRHLPPGAYRVHAGAKGVMSTSTSSILIKRDQRPQRQNFFCMPTCKLEGRLIGGSSAFISVERPDSHNERTGQLVWGRSSEDGAFTLSGVPTGNVIVSAFGMTKRWVQPLLVSLSPRDPNRVELITTSFGQATGQLRHENGKPLKHARVFLVDSSLATEHILNPARHELAIAPASLATATDAKGGFSFQQVPAGNYYLVIVTDEGPPDVSGPLRIQSGDNRQGLSRVVMPRAKAVTVSMKDGDVFQVVNRASGKRQFLSAPPGGGEVSFIPDALSLSDAWPVHVREVDRRSSLFVDSYQGVERKEGLAVLPMSGSASLIATPVPFARIIGQVLAFNAPVGSAGAVLRAFPVGGGIPFTVWVQPSTGLFDARLPRGRYILSGYAPGVGSGHIGPIALGTSADSMRVDGLLLRLKAHGRVLGRFDTPDGGSGGVRGQAVSPRADWEQLVHPWRDRVVSYTVDADGAFDARDLTSGQLSLELLGGQWLSRRRVHVRESDLQDWPTTQAELAVQWPPTLRRGISQHSHWRGEGPSFLHPEDQGEALRLSHSRVEGNRLIWQSRRRLVLAGAFARQPESLVVPRGSQLRGMLWLDNLRQPGRPFRLIPIHGWAYALNAGQTEAFVDEAGRVRVDALSPVPHALSLGWRDSGGISYTALEFLEAPGSANGGSVVTPRIDIKTAELEVLVTRRHDNSPLPGAVVRVRRKEMRGILAQTVFARDHGEIARGVSDSMGRVRFLSLVVGVHDIEVTSDEAGRVGIVDVTVSGKTSHNLLEVSMGDRAELRINGVTSTGTPMAHAEVFCFDVNGLEVFPERRLMTDVAGRVVITGLGEGPLEVLVQPRDGILQNLETVVLSRGGTAELNALEQPTGRFSLRIEDDSGEALEAASIDFGEFGGQQRLFPAGAEPWDEWNPVSAGDGGISVGPVAVGTYDLLVECAGYEPASIQVEVQVGRLTRDTVSLQRILK